MGLLLASGAGVYTYRQFIQPVPDAEDTAPDAARVAIPGPGFDQIASLREIAEPVETPVAVAPAIRPEPQARREAPSPVNLPRSSDEAFHVARSRGVAAFSGAPPSPGQQPAAEMAAKLSDSALPNVGPPPLEAAAPYSDERPSTPSMEPGSRIGEVGDATALLPPVSSEQAPAGESPAIAEAIADADPRLSDITGDDLEPSSMGRIPEAGQLPSGVGPADSIPKATEAQLAIADPPAPTPEVAVGELPDRPDELEPSAALASATGKEAVDELPAQGALLAGRSADGETVGDAKPAEGEPGFVPIQPSPAPMAPPAATQGASSPAEYVQRFPMVVLNGTPLGAVTVREFGDNRSMIHLGALLSLFGSRMDPAEFERLSTAVAADQFVSLEDLRRAGLDARYDARRGRLIFGSHNHPIDE